MLYGRCESCTSVKTSDVREQKYLLHRTWKAAFWLWVHADIKVESGLAIAIGRMILEPLETTAEQGIGPSCTGDSMFRSLVLNLTLFGTMRGGTCSSA